MRFPIRLGTWRPLLAILGARKGRAFVDVEPEKITFRFGGHLVEVPPSQILAAEKTTWAWWAGIGWRVGRDSFAMIGALDGVVRLDLASDRSMKVVGISHRYDRLYVSLEDPKAFLDALEAVLPTKKEE